MLKIGVSATHGLRPLPSTKLLQIGGSVSRPAVPDWKSEVPSFPTNVRFGWKTDITMHVRPRYLDRTCVASASRGDQSVCVSREALPRHFLAFRPERPGALGIERV